ncbi:unnamed protein product [Cuscuta epithymum]|uniref:Zinc finger PMZ-type domain-containing protein n=1 Tax=Cuscuta epithymum TaxID=186058 RepID=A0AAV0DIP5_9ASTE|nr:unnamed protein product [Cuscuta epithymum]
MWDLTGIPCKHGVCAIWLKYGKGPVYDYVSPYYSIDTFMKIYSGSINPMSGSAEWPITDKTPPLPPLYSNKPGRPKKMRKQSAGELTTDGERVARSRITLHSSNCKKPGHNCRKCPDNPKPKDKLPKKKTKSARTVPETEKEVQ